MLNIKEKPDRLLLFAAIALSLAFAFIPITRSDFQDKTMFGVPLGIFVWTIPLLLLTLWTLYLLTKRVLFSKGISLIHVLITVFTTMLTAIIFYIAINPVQVQLHHYFGPNAVEIIGNIARTVFFLFVFGQFIFLTNVLLGFFKKIK